MCDDRFIANLLLSVPKNFENWSICGKDTDKSLMSCFFTNIVYTGLVLSVYYTL